MEIKWKVSEEDSQFLIIYVDKLPWKTVFKSLFVRYLSGICRATSQIELEEKFQELEGKLARAYALKLLGFKGRLTQELREKLTLKNFSEKAISQAIEGCTRLGILNDQEEIKALIRREQRKGYGPNLIALKLRAKLQNEKAEALLSDARASQVETIHRLIEGKLRRCTDKQKLIHTLKRRGFDWESIRAVVKN